MKHLKHPVAIAFLAGFLTRLATDVFVDGLAFREIGTTEPIKRAAVAGGVTAGIVFIARRLG